MNKMIESIKPIEFWDKFSDRFNAMWFKNYKKSNEKYESDALWTNYIFKFLEDFGKKLGFETISKEYWPRLDICYFSGSEENWSTWSLEVAIEHENKPWPDWQNECNKLMMINAGLKVLFTYYKDNKTKFKNNLDKFIEIYMSRKYHQTNDQWLFIAAPTMNIWDNNDFVAFQFDGNKLEEITNGKNTFLNKR
jgi:hypothetical protein